MNVSINHKQDSWRVSQPKDDDFDEDPTTKMKAIEVEPDKEEDEALQVEQKEKIQNENDSFKNIMTIFKCAGLEENVKKMKNKASS